MKSIKERISLLNLEHYKERDKFYWQYQYYTLNSQNTQDMIMHLYKNIFDLFLVLSKRTGRKYIFNILKSNGDEKSTFYGGLIEQIYNAMLLNKEISLIRYKFVKTMIYKSPFYYNRSF
jgi:hypothetical protein